MNTETTVHLPDSDAENPHFDGRAVSRSPFWYCNVCNAQNHYLDGECQYCECGGSECKRDNCSDPRHPVPAD